MLESALVVALPAVIGAFVGVRLAKRVPAPAMARVAEGAERER